jgi:hypothetical protein
MSGTVSWQSAFWALVAIALNSMCQPSGKVCRFPSADSFYLRSSPIVCAVDSLQTILKSICFLLLGHPPRDAVARIARERFPNAADDDGDREDRFGSWEKHNVKRWIVLGFGSITQIVKLYALRGIPWTQAWATMFFLSWIVTELLVIVARRGRAGVPSVGDHGATRPDQHRETWADVMDSSIPGACAVFTQCVLSVVASIGGANPELTDNKLGGAFRFTYHMLPAYILISAAGALALSLLFALILIGIARLFGGDMPFELGFGIPFFFVFLVGLSSLMIKHLTPEDIFSFVVLMLLFNVGLPAWLIARKKLYESRGFQRATSMSFLLLNFLSTLIYYATRYSPEGTIKPAWTELLG